MRVSKRRQLQAEDLVSAKALCLACLRKSREASVAGAEGGR